jgi:YhcH/YjgK/YiaL family protein
MICDRIDNSGRYTAISPGIALALEALRSGRLASAPDGRHDLDGDNVFALVQRYATRPLDKCMFESHRKYIDVQMLISGSEAMGHSPISKLKVTSPYDDAKDVALYAPLPAPTWLKLSGGEFAIFFPEDGHMPCAQSGGPSDVVKIVVKVRADGMLS